MTPEDFVDRLNAGVVALMEEFAAANSGTPRRAIVALAGQAMVVTGAGYLAPIGGAADPEAALREALEFCARLRGEA